MPTFLWRASYTAEGAKGLKKDGGSKRRDVVQQMVTKAGGKLIAFYFAVGEADVYGIAEFPDVATAVGLSIAINASGSVSFNSTMLLSPEEMDAATKMSIGYSAPGS